MKCKREKQFIAAAVECRLSVKASSVSACPCISEVFQQFTVTCSIYLPVDPTSESKFAVMPFSCKVPFILIFCERWRSCCMQLFSPSWRTEIRDQMVHSVSVCNSSNHFRSTKFLENEDGIFLACSLIYTVLWNKNQIQQEALKHRRNKSFLYLKWIESLIQETKY